MWSEQQTRHTPSQTEIEDVGEARKRIGECASWHLCQVMLEDHHRVCGQIVVPDLAPGVGQDLEKNKKNMSILYHPLVLNRIRFVTSTQGRHTDALNITIDGYNLDQNIANFAVFFFSFSFLHSFTAAEQRRSIFLFFLTTCLHHTWFIQQSPR